MMYQAVILENMIMNITAIRLLYVSSGIKMMLGIAMMVLIAKVPKYLKLIRLISNL